VCNFFFQNHTPWGQGRIEELHSDVHTTFWNLFQLHSFYLSAYPLTTVFPIFIPNLMSYIEYHVILNPGSKIAAKYWITTPGKIFKFLGIFSQTTRDAKFLSPEFLCPRIDRGHIVFGLSVCPSVCLFVCKNCNIGHIFFFYW
jgi:hypothetical protein